MTSGRQPLDVLLALTRLLSEPKLRRRLAGEAGRVKPIAQDAREWIARYHAVRERSAR